MVSLIITITKEFGEEKVLGGLCFIETTLNDRGEIVQTSAPTDLCLEKLSLKIQRE